MLLKNQVRETLIEGQVADSKNGLLERLVDEVEYALYPPVHEKRKPTYGCIITKKLPKDSALPLNVQTISFDLAREVADGVSSFAVIVGKKATGIAIEPGGCTEEVDLLGLQELWKGFLVHRNSHDIVRIYSDGGIHIHHRGQWITRPHASHVSPDIVRAVPQVSGYLTSRILECAFHVLSPMRIGTTIVWWVDPKSKAPKGSIDLSTMGLSLAERSHFPALRSLLSMHDRAVVLGPDGNVLSLGYELKSSRKTDNLIPKDGGTRHTSARRYSYQESRAVVVVVSDDGPVSVYSDGVKVTEISQATARQRRRSLANLVPAKKDDIESTTEYTYCPTCKKFIAIDIVLIYGLRESESGECPICDTRLKSTRCFSIDTRVVKRLPHEPIVDETTGMMMSMMAAFED